MSDEMSPLYAELLGETAQISWAELAPYFAKGLLLWIDSTQDLILVAQTLVNDEKAQVENLMQNNLIRTLSDADAISFQERDPELWACVVSPWVLVQERKK